MHWKAQKDTENHYTTHILQMNVSLFLLWVPENAETVQHFSYVPNVNFVNSSSLTSAT